MIMIKTMMMVMVWGGLGYKFDHWRLTVCSSVVALVTRKIPQ